MYHLTCHTRYILVYLPSELDPLATRISARDLIVSQHVMAATVSDTDGVHSRFTRDHFILANITVRDTTRSDTAW